MYQRPLSVVLVAGICCCVILAGSAVRATRSGDFAEIRTLGPKQQAELLLAYLSKVLNDPTTENLETLVSSFPDEQQETLGRHLKTVFPAAQSKGETSLPHLSFEKVSALSKRDTLLVSTDLICETDRSVNRRPVTLRILEGKIGPYLVAPEDGLSQIAAFRDSCVEAASLLPRPQVQQQSASKNSTSSLVSANLLKEQWIYMGGHDKDPQKRLTRTSSVALFDDVIFGRPYGLLAVHTQEHIVQNTEYEFLIVSDPNWSRIITVENLRPMLFAHGTWGPGTNQFKQPAGLAFKHPLFFTVADGYNNRAVVYYFDELYDELTLIATVSDSFDYVGDVATAHIHQPPHTNYASFELAVLDHGHCRVGIYWFDIYSYPRKFDRRRFLFSPGSGDNQILNPTSVCYARHMVGHQHLPYVYVADAGNRRIVRQSTRSGNPWDFRKTNYQFPNNAYLTSVDVDAFGYVWTVDSYNSRVYVFSDNLDSLIATFGSNGVADGQLMYPNRLKVAESWNPDTTANVMGTVFATEMLGQDSGIRKFQMGCDILGWQASYQPKLTAQGADYVTWRWKQSGASTTTRIVYNPIMEVIDSVTDSLNLPGDHYQRYFLEDRDWNGEYKLELRVHSIFGTNDTTLVCPFAIQRSMDTTLQRPRFVFDEPIISDPYYHRSADCLTKDSTWWWQVDVHIEDRWYDTTRLQYRWKNATDNANAVRFAEDLLDPQPLVTLVTRSPRAYIMFVDTMKQFACGDTAWLFIVQAEDWSGGSFSPPDTLSYFPCGGSGGQSPPEMPWYPSWWFHGRFFNDACNAPCAEDVDPCCCIDTRGNVDGDPADLCDISDLSAMVDYLFFGGTITDCQTEADVDGSGGVDIGDLQVLIEQVFNGALALPCRGSRSVLKDGPGGALKNTDGRFGTRWKGYDAEGESNEIQ
jgi:hypothetical protein